MRKHLLPLLVLLSPAAFAADLDISVEIPRLDVAEYHRPYVALWLEKPDQSHVANLAVWYDLKMKDKEGEKWLKDLRQWWRRSGRSLEMPVLGIMNVVFTYKVAAPVSEDEVTVEQQMALVPAGDEPVAKFSNERSTGTIVWDAEAGRPETSVLSYEVEIEQLTNADGPLKLEQNTEFRRIADETQ